jgi:hypothetical protein
MTDLTAEEARRSWDYEPDTGLLRWKIRAGKRVMPGDVAGSLGASGYIVIGIKGKMYKAHRVAWLIHFGEWPDNQIDHINGIRDDNRIVNLRRVSKRQNDQNKKCHRDGHLVGTTRDKRRPTNPWRALIWIDGKQINLGAFPTQQKAHEAYVRAMGEKP